MLNVSQRIKDSSLYWHISDSKWFIVCHSVRRRFVKRGFMAGYEMKQLWQYLSKEIR